MTDTSPGQQADQWKKKFYDQLDILEQKESEWEKLETLLKRTIGRLSLAAEGNHRALDQHVRDLREVVREKIDTKQLESIIDKLSKALVKVEEKKSTAPRDVISVLESLTKSLELPESLHKAQEKLSKKLSKANDENYSELSAECLALISDALTTKSVAKSTAPVAHEKKPGLFDRLLGNSSNTANIEQETNRNHTITPASVNDLEMYRSCLTSFMDKLDTAVSPNGRIAALRVLARDAHERAELDNLAASLAEMLSEPKQVERVVERTTAATEAVTIKDDLQPSIQELLIRLLEQLIVPPDLIGDVDVMKTRLEKETEPEDWQKLLKDVAILINSIRSRMQMEKLEFESFLQQITNRLKELYSYLQTESDSLQLAENESKSFDSKMHTEVSDIRQDVSRASDLEDLKHSVQNRLDAISKHIKEYRSAEQNRFSDEIGRAHV